MNVKVSVQIALDILTQNKSKHVEEYSVQIKGWQKAMELHSEEMKKWVSSGGDSSKRPKEPVKPKDFSNEYDDYIQKLEFHVCDWIVLEDWEFDRIINNEFEWKDTFLQSSVTYNALANS